MTVTNAHFEGQKLVLDDPLPGMLHENARVQVVVQDLTEESALGRIAAMATDTGLPADYSVRFREYMRGERAIRTRSRSVAPTSG